MGCHKNRWRIKTFKEIIFKSFFYYWVLSHLFLLFYVYFHLFLIKALQGRHFFSPLFYWLRLKLRKANNSQCYKATNWQSSGLLIQTINVNLLTGEKIIKVEYWYYRFLMTFKRRIIDWKKEEEQEHRWQWFVTQNWETKKTVFKIWSLATKAKWKKIKDAKIRKYWK